MTDTIQAIIANMRATAEHERNVSDDCTTEYVADQLDAFADRLSALSARASAGEGEEIAWESTTVGFTHYVTDARYQKFSPEIRRWYKPYRCTNCTTAPQPAQAGASDGELVLVPRRLTAENGAKGLLSGEFCEHFEFKCAECDDDGMVDGETPCDDCDGRGSHRVKVPVEWTTIKAIHRMVVEHLAAAPQPQEAPAQERDDSGPYEFGAGIPDNPKAKYWQDRAYFWRSHAIALGYVAGDGTQHCHPAHGDGEGDDSAFIDWIVHEMPAGTIIGSPQWWAPRIARAYQQTHHTTRPTPEAQEARDGVRWRFVRDNPGINIVAAGGFYRAENIIGYVTPGWHGTKDAAIDAAIAALALPAQGEGKNG